MCGIVGAVAQRNVSAILIEGLHRLEYRGYDSAGLSIITGDQQLQTVKSAGKVAELETAVKAEQLSGHTGIAHTRWATHGKPNTQNSHPHNSGPISVVHNGIIENHDMLRAELVAAGYQFISDTDTEVVAHLVHSSTQQGQRLKDAVQNTIQRLEGAYALGVVSEHEPHTLIGARRGSPLVLGLGIEEHFIASDQMALRQVTDRFIFLQEGDLVAISDQGFAIYNQQGQPIERPMQELEGGDQIAHKGAYRHFMQKEIFEQATVLAHTTEGRIGKDSIQDAIFGYQAEQIFQHTQAVHIVACGTSYHSGLVAKYWLETYAGLPCQVEVASEYRYRTVAVPNQTLFVTISQSGETADTLAALHKAKQNGYLGFLAICNVANSSLVRESDISLMTMAGPEIGVASTKAFTTQLVALKLLSFSFLIFFNIFAESKNFISLEKYLSQIEIVSNSEDRKIGLMYRKSLPDERGMIFAWDRKKIQCMWMKNTSIPLSVAYIEDTGEIIGIYDMVPLSRKSVCSRKPALYALEVNQGWFEKNELYVGDFINISSVIQNAK